MARPAPVPVPDTLQPPTMRVPEPNPDLIPAASPPPEATTAPSATEAAPTGAANAPTAATPAPSEGANAGTNTNNAPTGAANAAPTNAPTGTTPAPADVTNMSTTNAPAANARPNAPEGNAPTAGNTTQAPTDANAGVPSYTMPQLADTVQGTLVRVDRDLGQLVVENEDGEFYVSGMPQQIESYQPGTSVQVPFENISGYYWLPLQRRQPPPAASSLQIIGDVQSVDAARGVLKIGRVTLRAHPDMLAAFVPGQTVQVVFDSFGEANWLRAIQRNAG